METFDRTRLAGVAALLSAMATAPALAQVDFGDDSSTWSRDGECDDPRFEGDGMASVLLDEDMLADATDCRSLYQDGRIRLRQDILAQGSPAAVGAVPAMEEHGELRRGDRSLNSGEFMDSYKFTGEPGQLVALNLTSADFDTYLILVGPDGDQEENDDADGNTGHSRIETELARSGTYEIIVTSYEPGEVGSYTLTLGAGSPRPATGDQHVTTLTAGLSTMGRLESGDPQIESGEYQDLFSFSGEAGQTVSVELSSSDFDTYVGLITPAGNVIENDDFEGDTALSIVRLTLPESGLYRVAATSYQAGETGDYKILVTLDSEFTAGVLPAGGQRRPGGNTYGIFAGISDYPGSDNDLDFTAEDAIRVRDALIRGGNMSADNAVTLTDGAATLANFRRAVEDVASRVGPEDTLVIFYSGHGDRVARAAGPESSDPDALDETIELYDGPLSDDELRAMLDPVSAGTTLLLLDSCFSGGFAKDIISVPGRMGLFSSEEDVTSQVAVKFRAGGYLAYFLDEAIGDRLADEDADGQVTALELSEYVHYRYRNDVKSAGPGDYVRTGGPQSGYQHLVVDRGSIGPYDVLFP